MSKIRMRIGLLAGLLALAGCGRAGEAAPPVTELTLRGEHGSAHDVEAGHQHFAADLATEVDDLSGHSIYHLDSEWWNQHGEVLPLESLAGRVQVISMVYTYCSYTCPKILVDMKRIEGAIGEPERLGFVLVSIDPERDTPDRLHYFAEATRLDPNAWALLSGSDDAILELATLLGIKYRRDSETDFSHSNTMLVLNREGEIVYRQHGLGEELGPMLEAIRRAMPSSRAPMGG